MATSHELFVVNESPENVLDFCVYQTPPDRAMPTLKSLAWLVKPAHTATVLRFAWTVDYSFVWSQPGPLLPGSIVEASQVVPADPDDTSMNQIQLDKTDGAYLFVPGPVPGLDASAGTLYVSQTANVIPREANVGIGMSGSGVLAIEAEPNMLATFTPQASYWLVAGEFTSGQVVDLDDITDAQQIEFPPGVTVVTATLSNTNTWSVTPGPPP